MKSIFNFRFTPTVLLTLFIAWIIYQADTDQDSFLMMLADIQYMDKVAHFTLFGLLALSVNSAIGFRAYVFGPVSIYLGSVIVLSVTWAEEFSQLAIASRTFDWVDMLFDVLGIYFFSSDLFLNLRSRLVK